MNILFRVDAGFMMGTGHFMRCLTLAQGLKKAGYTCLFATSTKSYQEASQTVGLAEKSGFSVFLLNDTLGITDKTTVDTMTGNNPWLAVSQEEDAASFNCLLKKLEQQGIFVDLIVIDHYGIDAKWHAMIQGKTPKMVIDDCANRPLQADLLLDQNLGRQAIDYQNLVDKNCQLLIGLNYALLRDEFLNKRTELLMQNKLYRKKLKNIVISMGGADHPNSTGKILLALLDQERSSIVNQNKDTNISHNKAHRVTHNKAHMRTQKETQALDKLTIKVILGSANPFKNEIDQIAVQFQNFQVKVIQGAEQMAEHFAEADLAIGAAGSTSWERCALGLPTLVIELAENQRLALNALSNAGAAFHTTLEKFETEGIAWLNSLLEQPLLLSQMSCKAAQLVDGQGVQRVVQAIKSL